MTTTTVRSEATLPPDEGTDSMPVVPPPKLRRRPAMIGAGIVAIVLGALLAAWAWTATTNTTEVLAARTTIERGSVIEADDLVRVRLGTDPALNPVPARDLVSVVGRRASVDIAQGGLLTPDSFTRNVVPGHGNSVVGVALNSSQIPGSALKAGDWVRVVLTPAEGEAPTTASPQFTAAEVVSVQTDAETGLHVVDLLVRHDGAATLASQVATGNIALVLDSREQ